MKYQQALKQHRDFLEEKRRRIDQVREMLGKSFFVIESSDGFYISAIRSWDNGIKVNCKEHFCVDATDDEIMEFVNLIKDMNFQDGI